MKSLTNQQLHDELKRIEQKWLRADTAVHQSRLILEAAASKFQNAQEADASILVEAAQFILDSYAGET